MDENNNQVNNETVNYGPDPINNGSSSNQQSPVYETEEASNNTGKIIPIYPLTYSLSQNTIRKIIENGLKEVQDKLPETMPERFLEQYNLYDINTAIKQIHFPEDFK